MQSGTYGGRPRGEANTRATLGGRILHSASGFKGSKTTKLRCSPRVRSGEEINVVLPGGITIDCGSFGVEEIRADVREIWRRNPGDGSPETLAAFQTMRSVKRADEY